ncbi:MAG: methyltransferase domain-containing protein [Candidatus Hydrogenedentes bacterium]|nr:methyltransferase domain-containing protein [Candidatus Hydrogenedentota bacterium]
MYGDTAPLYDIIFPYNPAVVACIQRYLPAGPARILDIGCGTGKYSAALADDHEVTGIDPDSPSIAIARKRGSRARFDACDLFGLPNRGPFDLIFCIGNVIAHIPPDSIGPLVNAVRARLSPGGVWLFHTINWDPILRHETHAFPIISREGVTFVRRYQDIRPERVLFHTRLTAPGGEVREHRVPLYPLPAARIDALHEGFTLLDHFTDYSGSPFNPDAPAQIRVYRNATG